MVFILDIGITLKADTLQNIASKRAFIYDNATNDLVDTLDTLVRNVTFTRGGEIPFENIIYVSVDVSLKEIYTNLMITSQGLILFELIFTHIYIFFYMLEPWNLNKVKSMW